MRISVLGGGAWGTALATMLEGGGHSTSLWCRDPSAATEIAAGRENRRYLPGHPLPESLLVTADLPAALAGAELAILALPSSVVRSVARRLSPILPADTVVVCASKGLEEGTHLTLDRVLAQELPGAPVVMLSGPTFAPEVAAGLPAAAVAASAEGAAAALVQQALAGDRFRVYTTEDVLGVAVGGALKNVIAIAAGCSDGLGFGQNARAAIITRGLHEMARLVERLGANPLTLAGLAGLGDLVLTCTGELSRNRRVGLALGRGEALAQIVARLGHVAEGIQTARVADEQARALGVRMPITAQVAAVVSGQRSPREAVADLLSREQGTERG